MNSNRQQGHIETGFTLVAMVLIGIVLYWSATTSEGIVSDWLAWHWGYKILSILAIPVVLLLAGVFETSRKWPKTDFDNK